MMMDPVEVAERMKMALRLLDDLAEEMNTATKVCSCCGISVRENMDDWQAHQAFDAAARRVEKMYEKLTNGFWSGRSLVPVMDASAARAAQEAGDEG